MNPTEQLITLRRIELETLHGAGPLAFEAYVMLRGWMDYRTGITGRSRPISLAMLATYCETHTPRGAGTQIEKPTEKRIRGALDRLERAGLLHPLAGPRLAYRLPLAATASARPNQTGHGAGTPPPTEPGAVFPAPALETSPELGTLQDTSKGTNRAHIRNHVLLLSTCALVDYLEQQNVSTAGKEETIERWRADGLTLNALQQAMSTAHAVRTKAGSTQPVNIGLLDSLLINAPRVGYRRTGGGLIATGTAQGKPPRPGESWEAYRQRIAAHSSPCNAKTRRERAPC